MKITRIESLLYGIGEVEAGIRYYDDWGLKPLERGRNGADFALPSGQVIRLRSAGDATLPQPIEAGSTVREIVWGVEEPASLEEIGAELSRDGEAALHADGTLHAQDSAGLAVAFRVAAPVDTLGALPEPRLNHAFSPPPRATPSRIGHAVFFVPKSRMKALQNFYLDRLQFRLSDRVEDFGDFMRCNGSRDHHNLFLLQRDERAGFNHAAFEVKNFDEVMVGGKHMQKSGWKQATRPGRHIMGANLFWYFQNPSGGNTEYFADMDIMDDGWQPRIWQQNPGFAFWMME